jgi:hypothetical protein
MFMDTASGKWTQHTGRVLDMQPTTLIVCARKLPWPHATASAAQPHLTPERSRLLKQSRAHACIQGCTLWGTSPPFVGSRPQHSPSTLVILVVNMSNVKQRLQTPPPPILQPRASALNNASWALGLLVQALPVPIALPVAVPAAERLIALLKVGTKPEVRRVRENAGISLGRVATVAPQPLAEHLSHFLGDWCFTLMQLRVRPLSDSFAATTFEERGSMKGRSVA